MTNKLYEMEYLKNKNKTKLSPKQAIQKFLIYINIKYNPTIQIICAWDSNQVQHLIEQIKNVQFPFIFIDYSHDSREWYLHYNNKNIIQNAVIDDITGTICS